MNMAGVKTVFLTLKAAVTQKSLSYLRQLKRIFMQQQGIFGTILENVGYDSMTRELDLDDDSITENTRASYPITHIKNIRPLGRGGHPKNIIMLTCDSFWCHATRSETHNC